MYIFAIWLALMSFAAAQPTPEPIPLTLTQEQLNVVWAGLQELPGRIADPVKAELQRQVQSAAKAKAPSAKAPKPELEK